MAMTPETRDYRMFEMRAMPTTDSETGGEQYRVEGYAAKFNEETVLFEIEGVKYREVIRPGAFSGAKMQDVVMNYNHGGKPVARTKNGTLTLTTDLIGLHVVADLGGTEEGRRLYEEIQGGYIDKMSFAFTVRTSTYDKATRLRSIEQIDRLFDVAAVDIPAYDCTEIAARSWAKAEALREQAAEAARRKLEIKLSTYGIN